MTTRLIERYLPIAEIGIESLRERTPMTPFPAPNRLHVWWARRPLVASRAAVLASILPEDADRDAFKHALGIHGDSVKGAMSIERARRTGIRVDDPYGAERAFKYSPTSVEIRSLTGRDSQEIVVLDATAGGGAIPLEAVRLGFSAIGNDLNPIASFLQKATIEYPQKFGRSLVTEFDSLSTAFRQRIGSALADYFPQPNAPDEMATSALWCRTIRCPYCAGKVPLSPSWRLAPSGVGMRVIPNLASGPGDTSRECTFEIVHSADAQSGGTVSGGDAVCVFSDCGRPIDGLEIKKQARAGGMGDQLFAIVFRRKVTIKTKTGKNRLKWERGYRACSAADDNATAIEAALEEKAAEWEALDILPTEGYPEHMTDNRFAAYSKPFWRDMFSSRQLLAHGTGVELYRTMLDEDKTAGKLTEVRAAAYGYLGSGPIDVSVAI